MNGKRDDGRSNPLPARANPRTPVDPRIAARGPIDKPWNWYATGPLRGIGLMRERQRLFAFDDGHNAYVFNPRGELLAQTGFPREVRAMAASDTGELLVAVSRIGEVWWLDEQLRTTRELRCPGHPLAVAVDPHGDYVVIADQTGRNFIYSARGKLLTKFESIRPLKFLRFALSQGCLIAAADLGFLGTFDIAGQRQWFVDPGCNVGAMAIAGDGESIFLAGFGRGILRFDGDGKAEGAYRIDGSPELLDVDYDGKCLVGATLEQRLVELDYDGVVGCERMLPQRPVGLTLDPLGRYVALAYPNGELVFAPLPEYWTDDESDAAILGEPDRLPVWEVRAADSIEEAQSAVMMPVLQSGQLGCYTNRRTLRIFDGEGKIVHETPVLIGVGRAFAPCGKWLCAFSDRAIVAYDPIGQQSWLSTLTCFEIGDVHAFATCGDLLLVESCEQVRRVRLPDTEVWKRRMEYRVESVAALEDGAVALALDDCSMVVYDGEGKRIGKFYDRAQPEPMMLQSTARGWVTAVRDAALLRGHFVDGRVQWTTPLTLTPWTLQRHGAYIVVTGADGRSILFNDQGEPQAENAEPRTGAQYFSCADGSVGRIFLADQTLIATTFDGKLIWRHTDHHAVRSFCADGSGVWAFMDRILTHFSFE